MSLDRNTQHDRNSESFSEGRFERSVDAREEVERVKRALSGLPLEDQLAWADPKKEPKKKKTFMQQLKEALEVYSEMEKKTLQEAYEMETKKHVDKLREQTGRNISDLFDPLLITDELKESIDMRRTPLHKYEVAYKRDPKNPKEFLKRKTTYFDDPEKYKVPDNIPDHITCRYHREKSLSDAEYKKKSGTLYVYVLGNRQRPEDECHVGCFCAYRSTIQNGHDAIMFRSGQDFPRLQANAKSHTEVLYNHGLN